MKVFVIGASGLVGGNTMRIFRENGCDVKGSFFTYKTEDCVF